MILYLIIDYINQFIEHHLNIGFNFFYIIVDNLDFEQIDYKNIISSKYHQNIKLYNMDKNFNFKYYQELINNNGNTHNYWINYFNNVVLKDVTEDWLLIEGCDSFLYLNGLNINNFINNVLKINKNTFQIAFPWLSAYNLENLELTNDKFLFPDHAVFGNYKYFSKDKVTSFKEKELFWKDDYLFSLDRIPATEIETLRSVVIITTHIKKIYNFIDATTALNLISSEDEQYRIKKNK